MRNGKWKMENKVRKYGLNEFQIQIDKSVFRSQPHSFQKATMNANSNVETVLMHHMSLAQVSCSINLKPGRGNKCYF